MEFLLVLLFFLLHVKKMLVWENPLILKLDPFASIAKRPMILKGIFKSQDDYNKAVKELEEELYKVI